MNGTLALMFILGILQALILWLLQVIFARQSADATSMKTRLDKIEKSLGDHGERISKVESDVDNVGHRLDLSGEAYQSLVERMDTIHRDMVTKADLMMLVEVIKSGSHAKS